MKEVCKKCKYLTGKKGHQHYKCYCGDCPAKKQDMSVRKPNELRPVKSTELIRMTVLCGTTNKLIDVDYEEVKFINWNKHIAGVNMYFNCQLCGKKHTVKIM